MDGMYGNVCVSMGVVTADEGTCTLGAEAQTGDETDTKVQRHKDETRRATNTHVHGRSSSRRRRMHMGAQRHKDDEKHIDERTTNEHANEAVYADVVAAQMGKKEEEDLNDDHLGPADVKTATHPIGTEASAKREWPR
ncbi:hypothetical protein C8J57DRAFT_1482146 [Mycena rebaudengoi]|nr:hypothetical protein C8J57DRAFT_1482146 [Mycena rebaudengoi]